MFPPLGRDRFGSSRPVFAESVLKRTVRIPLSPQNRIGQTAASVFHSSTQARSRAGVGQISTPETGSILNAC